MSLTEYTYGSLFAMSLYIIIASHMFRPYIVHDEGKT